MGILSRFAIEWERRAGRLAELRVPQFPIRRPLYGVHHRRKHLTRMITAFLGLLGNQRR